MKVNFDVTNLMYLFLFHYPWQALNRCGSMRWDCFLDSADGILLLSRNFVVLQFLRLFSCHIVFVISLQIQ